MSSLSGAVTGYPGPSCTDPLFTDPVEAAAARPDSVIQSGSHVGVCL